MSVCGAGCCVGSVQGSVDEVRVGWRGLLRSLGRNAWVGRVGPVVLNVLSYLTGGQFGLDSWKYPCKLMPGTCLSRLLQVLAV